MSRPNHVRLLHVLLISQIALGTAGTVWAQGGPPGGMPPTPVEVAKPTREAVVEAASAVGSLRANEAVVLRAELPGRIESIHFEEGSRVNKGDLLFTLDASLTKAEVAEWEATVAQSQREMDRANDLVAKKLAAQNDLDAKRSLLAIDQARLGSARTRLAKSQIRAPFSGMVGLRQVSVGEYIQSADELVSLVQVDPLKVDFRVPESLAARVAAGLEVEVGLDAYPGEVFTGKVYAVDPQVDVQTRSVMLRATLANREGRLRPGQFANVRVELARRADSLTIPEQALWPQGGKQYVYVIEAGKAALQEVRIGKRSAGRVEVLSGLSADADVIIAGQLKIGPGSPVVPLNLRVAKP
ncbi:efflux transporter periplasmic adaptor subunit [Ahniella affigens]|uniref:Efflux transporter periplasmic adaptor subunit n=1 Tax=Ahniella affigens TaxID=2021234 RepID=A0A2P1PN27_9GAMM|nr:efflux RND transporter periplasmic adaptor subunit [Ahniella affigens]AVP96227.1 efflux transporter periplasmic adaptor subunit [Ahniella affigens]